MARPLTIFEPAAESPELSRRRSLVNQSAARALAAATSALLIATLVITRSSDALITEGTAAVSSVSSGTIAVSDDDRGQSLFDLSAMAPGRPELRCLEVVYEGTILPVDLLLKAESQGELARYLDVTIEEGRGGNFETCEGFEPANPIFAGTLAELSEARWLSLGRIANSGDSRTYRIRFDLQDSSDALGHSTSANFVWEVTPS